MKRPPGLPLFAQTLGLVVATLLAALSAAAIVILQLPPPPPGVHTVQDVATAVSSAGARGGGERETTYATHLSMTPPAVDTFGRRRIAFRDALARTLGVTPTSVVVSQTGTRIIAVRSNRPDARSAMPFDGPTLLGSFTVGVRQADGRWLIVEPATTFGLDPWQQRILLTLALAALAVTPLAWALSRRLAAPIAALAAGAERLGRDPGAPPLDLRGSSDVVAAANAFNKMQERINRYVEDRTGMIAAIAHDLRTPLTRLRFRIDGIDEPLRAKIESDLDQMEAMITSTLSFVKDAASPHLRERLELSSLVASVIDEAAQTGAKASMKPAERVVVDGDSLALKRLVANLVDNAIKYGKAARAQVLTEGDAAIILVEDDGPGVPTADLDKVFEPFHRLENSRNRRTGGIGLGLAVVRAVARSHGGDVVLSNRPKRGLTVRVSLPLPARA